MLSGRNRPAANSGLIGCRRGIGLRSIGIKGRTTRSLNRELPLVFHDGQGVYHATMSVALRPCFFKDTIMNTSIGRFLSVGFTSIWVSATSLAVPPAPAASPTTATGAPVGTPPGMLTPVSPGGMTPVTPSGLTPVSPTSPPPVQPAPVSPAGVSAVNAVPSLVQPTQPLPAQPSPLAQPSPPIVAPPTPVPMTSPSEPVTRGQPGANACAGLVGTASTNCTGTPHQ